MIPEYLSLSVAEKINFRAPIIHSAHFGARLGEILSKVPPTSAEIPGRIVVVGGGKSAQEYAHFFFVHVYFTQKL
jgi:hypothetical protein